MKKLKIFWKVFVRSLTDFSYYKDILKTKFSFSLKYLYLLFFFTSLLSGILFARDILVLLPDIPGFVSGVKRVVKDLYPQELVITIKNYELSTNVEEPYFILLPPELYIFSQSDRFESTTIKNLVAIDTSANIEDFPEYNSIVLVTKNGFIVPDSNNGYKIYFFSQYKQLKGEKVFTRLDYDNIVNTISPYLDYLKPLAIAAATFGIFILPVVGAGFALLIRLLTLLANGFLVWIMSIFLGKGLQYKEAYRLSMHGITINVVLGAVLGIFDSYLNFLLSVLVFLVFMFLVLKNLPKVEKSPVLASEKTPSKT